MRLFKLKFKSALHVDSRGSGEPETAEDYIRSDTLSAALCLAWAAIYPKTDSEFFLDPPFTVSSAFPYIGSTFFLPIPIWRIWKDESENNRKRIKNIRWISMKMFEKVLNGHQIDLKEIHELPCGMAVFENEMGKNSALGDAPAWVMDERQRISVDRLGMPAKGGLFFFAMQFFAPSSGLYFISAGDESVLDQLRTVLDYLGDTGIGADRNSGLGHFSVMDETEFQLPRISRKGGWMNLSIFNPGPDDDLPALTAKTAYGLATRSGWVSGSTVGRPQVRAFTEGSYFSAKPVGRVVQTIDETTREKFKLAISHTAPRDFRTLFLPCAEPLQLKEIV